MSVLRIGHGYDATNPALEVDMQTAQPRRRPPTISAPTPAAPTPAAHGTELVDEMDQLLDDIDALLESNTVVDRYRQRGGQ